MRPINIGGTRYNYVSYPRATARPFIRSVLGIYPEWESINYENQLGIKRVTGCRTLKI